MSDQNDKAAIKRLAAALPGAAGFLLAGAWGLAIAPAWLGFLVAVSAAIWWVTWLDRHPTPTPRPAHKHVARNTTRAVEK
jgi:hypothetical protein